MCHSTGWPYKTDFLNSSVSLGAGNEQATTTGTVEHWKDHGYQIMYWHLGSVKAGTFFSPKFQLPETTRVKYSTAICYFTSGSAVWPFDGQSVNIYSGITYNLDKSTSKTNNIKRIGSNAYPSLSNFTKFDYTFDLSNGGRVSIGSDETKDGNGAENWVTIAYLNIEYVL